LKGVHLRDVAALTHIVLCADELNEGCWIAKTPNVPELFIREDTPQDALDALLNQYEKLLAAT
jgi:hypothetical protein